MWILLQRTAAISQLCATKLYLLTVFTDSWWLMCLSQTLHSLFYKCFEMTFSKCRILYHKLSYCMQCERLKHCISHFLTGRPYWWWPFEEWNLSCQLCAQSDRMMLVWTSSPHVGMEILFYSWIQVIWEYFHNRIYWPKDTCTTKLSFLGDYYSSLKTSKKLETFICCLKLAGAKIKQWLWIALMFF